MSSAEENHPAKSFTPFVKAAFIQDRSMGGCPLRPHLLVSIWDNSEVLSSAPGPAKSFGPWHCSSGSVCPILFLLLSHPSGPPGKLRGMQTSLSESASWGTHPATAISKTDTICILTELWGSICPLVPPLFLPKGKPEGFPNGLAGKESTCNAGDTGDTGSIPGSGRSPGEGNGNPLQYLAWESHGQMGLPGYSPWDRKRVRHYWTAD